MNTFVKCIAYACCVVAIVACNTTEKLVYFQDESSSLLLPEAGKVAPIPDPEIKVGDLLTITVNSSTQEAALPFNLPLVPTVGQSDYDVSGNSVANYSGGLQNYVVSTEGTIVMPVIGELKVTGLKKTGLAQLIQERIYPRYLKELPIVLIRFANFQVSVLGEVTRPGTYPVKNDKLSIPEALALAGDLTIYGRRDNILLIRENTTHRERIRIDLRDTRLLESPYYFMQQGDVLYVQPNDPKLRSSALSSAETITISIVGTLISLTSLIVNILK